jgi:hypothetical protein
MLKKLPLSEMTAKQLNLDDAKKEGLTLLIHYLAREEKAKVSIQKLRESFHRGNKIMPQEQIDDLKKVERKISGFKRQGTVPFDIRQFLHWMEEEKHDINKIFS